MSELNIIDRGVNSSEWTSEGGKLDRDSLHKVMEQRTDNSSALNALPTPFARFFVVKEAFRRVCEERTDPCKSIFAGRAYERLVSDCLDIYELLFNQGYHDVCNDRIVVKEWSLERNMPSLKEKVRILHDTVENYMKDDLGKDTDKLYFIVLQSKGKEYLLGTSSSLTGFITPPDLDKKTDKDEYLGERYQGLPVLKRKGNYGRYFQDICLLEDRSQEFKNYMYNTFSKTVDGRLAEIRDYVRSYANDPEIKNDFCLELTTCKTEDCDDLVINGLSICRSKEVGSYFTDVIIKLPFKISRENYKLPVIEGGSDYLLPLSEEAISRMNVDDLDISIRERRGGNVSVTIKVNGKEEKKEYAGVDSAIGNEGKILDLLEYGVTLDLGLFPNIRSDIKEENNYYKLMIVERDKSKIPTVSVDDIICEFYEKGQRIDEATDEKFSYGVRLPVVRSLQRKESTCGTKFYELFNTVFDLMRLSIKIEGMNYFGVLIPLWKKSNNERKSYIYAVDLGTTNTFVSRRVNSKDSYEPEQLRMDCHIMSYLHDKREMKQKKEIDLWEDLPESYFLDYFQTEFIPPFIDGVRYKFPIRTAMSKSINRSDANSLFDSRNIAFSYARRKIVGDNETITEIKWDEDAAKAEANLFIRELLMLMKYDMLQENADLKSTQLIWFTPLSLKEPIKKLFERIWLDQSKEILGITSNQLKCYTESEAPYYYFSKKDLFRDISSVVLVDIGGGSTDVVYFEQEMPVVANSVHFGCDVLWGNGHNEMKNARENGIFDSLKDRIHFETGSELEKINKEMIASSTYTTKEIINFWLTNKEKCGVADILRDEYAYLFMYHYAAIIYYIVGMLKSKGLKCPSAIAFSGNGSRYIDDFLTTDVEQLSELTMIILKKEFPDAKPVELILEDNRKESTCYGGLYRPSTASTPESYIFMGVDGKQYKKISELKDAFDNGLCDELKKRIDTLNDYYLDMLVMMKNRQNLDKVPVGNIKKELKIEILEKLQTDFTKEIRQYDEDVQMNDTLFFMPVIDLICNLTKI